jgi:hypothetical protein
VGTPVIPLVPPTHRNALRRPIVPACTIRATSLGNDRCGHERASRSTTPVGRCTQAPIGSLPGALPRRRCLVLRTGHVSNEEGRSGLPGGHSGGSGQGAPGSTPTPASPPREYTRDWLPQRVLRPRTYELYEGLLRRHLLPELGDLRLNQTERPVASGQWPSTGLGTGQRATRATLSPRQPGRARKNS